MGGKREPECSETLNKKPVTTSFSTSNSKQKHTHLSNESIINHRHKPSYHRCHHHHHPVRH